MQTQHETSAVKWKASKNRDLFVDDDACELTILSFGGGQDSTAILEKIVHDQTFRQKYVHGRFLVIMADTGDEHPETIEFVARVKERCARYRIDFVHVTADMGFHPPGWGSLMEQYRTHNTVGSKTFHKTCTDNLKIKPIYRFIEKWVQNEYGISGHNKRGLREFAATYGKIRVLIGIAKGEEARVADSTKDTRRWYRESVTTVYPLIAEGMDRAACQQYIQSVNQEVPVPSNCMRCPYMNLTELEYLRRFHSDKLNEWVERENAKLDKFAHLGEKNLGVWGAKKLPEVVKLSAEKHAEWSDEQIRTYRFSHGHCVKSKY